MIWKKEIGTVLPMAQSWINSIHKMGGGGKLYAPYNYILYLIKTNRFDSVQTNLLNIISLPILQMGDPIYCYAGFRLACCSPHQSIADLLPDCCLQFQSCSSLSSHATLAFPPSNVAFKLNRSQLSAVCRCGQSGKVID